jgi:hypothetical protein
MIFITLLFIRHKNASVSIQNLRTGQQWKKFPDNYSYLQTEVSKKNLSSDYPEFFLFWLKSLETKLKS